MTYRCTKCGAEIHFGECEGVPEPLLAAFQERVIAEHVCAEVNAGDAARR